MQPHVDRGASRSLGFPSGETTQRMRRVEISDDFFSTSYLDSDVKNGIEDVHLVNRFES